MLKAVPGELRPEDRLPDPQASPQTATPLPASPLAMSDVGHEPSTLLGAIAATTKLILLWVAITWLTSQSFCTLLEGEEPLFPNPWLLAGIAHALALGVCRLLVLISGYDNARDEEAVDITSATVLGLMFGVESGIYTGMFTDWVAGRHEEAFLLRPAVMCVAGLLAGTEPLRGRLVVVAVAATLGGALVAPGGVDVKDVLTSMPSLFAAGALTAFRWVFVLNVLPRGGGMPPLWFFTGQLMWPSAAVCFELAVLSDYTSYRQLLHLPQPRVVLGHVLGLAMLAGAQMAVELRLVQVTSLTMLGLATPLLNAVTLAKLYFTQARLPLSENLVGLALYCASAAFYWKSRSSAAAEQQTQEAMALEKSAASSGYQRLEAGSPRGSASPRSMRSPTRRQSRAGQPRTWLPVPDVSRLQPGLLLGGSPMQHTPSRGLARGR